MDVSDHKRLSNTTLETQVKHSQSQNGLPGYIYIFTEKTIYSVSD
jgi:hypothetical protein